MDKITLECKVFYNQPFYVAVLEMKRTHQLQVCQVIFRNEPSDQMIFDYITHHFHQLSFSPSVVSIQKAKIKNPKRLQREIKKQTQQLSLGTKSMQALKYQHEKCKQEKIFLSKQYKDKIKKQKFDKKQQKKKEKHKGH